jgi:hypothetical protein
MFHCFSKCCLDAVNSFMFLRNTVSLKWQTMRFIQILIESEEWFSPFSLSEPLVERRAFERRAKREIQKMNAWASAIQSKNLSGEQIANLEKMSECPALRIGKTRQLGTWFFFSFTTRIAYWRTESVRVLRQCATNCKKSWKLKTRQYCCALPNGARCIVASI